MNIEYVIEPEKSILIRRRYLRVQAKTTSIIRTSTILKKKNHWKTTSFRVWMEWQGVGRFFWRLSLIQYGDGRQPQPRVHASSAMDPDTSRGSQTKDMVMCRLPSEDTGKTLSHDPELLHFILCYWPSTHDLILSRWYCGNVELNPFSTKDI